MMQLGQNIPKHTAFRGGQLPQSRSSISETSPQWYRKKHLKGGTSREPKRILSFLHDAQEAKALLLLLPYAVSYFAVWVTR